MPDDSLPFSAPDPRQFSTSEGEAFRRRTRAAALLDLVENVGTERRTEIARELTALNEEALPALYRSAASRHENAAALSRSLIRLLVPDEIGRQIFSGIAREKQNYRVEHGAILLARLANPNLAVLRVIREVEDLANRAFEFVHTELDIPRKQAKAAAKQRTVEIVKQLGAFWRNEGFHGSNDSYGSDRNSYLPDVLERKTGLPIALSVLFLALARRLFLNADGVGLPGHFIVRVGVTADEGEQFILLDPFNGARPVNVDECRMRVESLGHPFIPDEHLRAIPARDILSRMCNNLLALFDHQKKPLEAERVVTVLSHIQPRDPIPLLLRAERRLRRNDRKGARADFEKAISLDPSGPIGRTAQEMLRRMGYESPFS